MKLSKGDLINNMLPIVVTFDDGGDKCIIPSMCTFTVLEIKDNSDIVVILTIPKTDIKLLTKNSCFRLNTFAMRN